MGNIWDSIYAPAPITPVVHIGERLGIFTGNGHTYQFVKFIEGMPAGSPMIADILALSGGTVLAAAGAPVNKTLAAILQVNTNEFLHLRLKPLDDVEITLWEPSGGARFNARGVQARLTLDTQNYDPHMACSTIFVYGLERDVNLQVQNMTSYALPGARVAFWGYRYILTPIDPSDQELLQAAEGGLAKTRGANDLSASQRKTRLESLVAELKSGLKAGDPLVVKEIFGGAVTFVPAQGQAV
ncbi:MAG: hypothetical protein Q8P59_08780 [Dehalococcoidia bacterium]|nr:hypothetical protein [Dehalococcoidia bacterium]